MTWRAGSRLRRSLATTGEILVRLVRTSPVRIGLQPVRHRTGGPLLAWAAAVVFVRDVRTFDVGRLSGGIVDPDADAGLRHPALLPPTSGSRRNVGGPRWLRDIAVRDMSFAVTT